MDKIHVIIDFSSIPSSQLYPVNGIDTREKAKKFVKTYAYKIQYIVFKEPVLANELNIKILDVSKGSKYNETCISEIEIFVK